MAATHPMFLVDYAAKYQVREEDVLALFKSGDIPGRMVEGRLLLEDCSLEQLRAMAPPDSASHAYVAELWLAYPIPVGLALAAATKIDVVLGILFSAHGGIGWIALLAALPWVIARASIIAFDGRSASKPARRRRAMCVLAGYVPISLLVSQLLVFQLNPPLQLTWTGVVAWHYFPFSIGML